MSRSVTLFCDLLPPSSQVQPHATYYDWPAILTRLIAGPMTRPLNIPRLSFGAVQAEPTWRNECVLPSVPAF